jgi:hypothetical protein
VAVVLADRDRTGFARTDPVLVRFDSLLRTLGGRNRLETPANRPEGNRDRENFFPPRARVVGVPRRKPVPETAFGFGKVRRVGPEVPREPETIEVILVRTFVHNVVAYQQIRWRGGVRAIDSVPCNDRPR